jgi:hypothetical protein
LGEARNGEGRAFNVVGKGGGRDRATERVVILSKPGNAGGGKGPYF